MRGYDHNEIEKKWQDFWAKSEIFRTDDDPTKKKCYVLDMFPYPSGNGLHVGHPEGYTATDIIARKRRMEGWNVLHPMGWDAFGLPAENFAIKSGVHPKDSTWKNIDNFRRQLQSLGFSYDWSREVNTADPSYYRWTQWLFLFLYKKGLAYKAKAPVNWCDSCQTVLANEQVVDGACERCKHPVIQKELSQWFFRVTDYADRLLEGAEKLDWPHKIKAMQKNWIGRSEGTEISFRGVMTPVSDVATERSVSIKEYDLAVFTTRPDTLFGVTYVVLAPEHPLVEQIVASDRRDEVLAYVRATRGKSELQRTGLEQEKTGVPLGASVVHPLTGASIPVWIADYALATYGTGAVMGVPAHDDRDFAFAKKYALPITTVIEPVTGEPQKDPEHRRSIVALVEDPTNGKILSIDWGSAMGGHLFVGGGREENEDAETCARREVREETGYVDLELVGTSETIHHHYFAHSKNVGRAIDAVGLHFRLKSDRREAVAHEADEQGKFTVEWLTPNEAGAKVGDALHAYVFRKFILGTAYTDDGILTGSSEFNGLTSEDAKRKITDALAAKNAGGSRVQYHLRDWLISRQRYWGAPIPIIYCDACGEVPVPETDLPVLLPYDVDFRPTGESPLARSPEFHEVKCPHCGAAARRESDTMDTFVDSSWYFLRYTSPGNEERPFDSHAVNYWCPVDLYVGGAEHAVLHLLYARFFTKVLHEHGLIPFDEPFTSLKNPGLIMGEDGQKMSKSRGNVINPDDVVAEYGADTLRMYEMFMGDFEDAKPWDTKSIVGIRRFLDRMWTVTHDTVHARRASTTSPDMQRALHRTIKKVSADIEACKFNTAISAMMILLNDWTASGGGDTQFAETFVLLLSPFAPHLCEELWELLGHKKSTLASSWPTHDESLLKEENAQIIIQVNGKVRERIDVPVGASEDEVKAKAFATEKIAALLEGKTIVKSIFVPDKLLNVVIE